MKTLDKTEDGNLDEQEKIKKTTQETEWELKPQYVIIALVVFVTSAAAYCFLYDLPLQWIHRLLEEAVFDLTADHYRCSDRISVKSNHEIFRGTPA